MTILNMAVLMLLTLYKYYNGWMYIMINYSGNLNKSWRLIKYYVNVGIVIILKYGTT